MKKAGGVYYTPDLHRRLHRQEHRRRAPRREDAQAVAGAPSMAAPPAHPRSGMRLGIVPHRRLSAPTRLAPRLVFERSEKWSKGKEPNSTRDRRGDWRLTTAERKRILLNNIYGVDIDSQAVEVRPSSRSCSRCSRGRMPKASDTQLGVPATSAPCRPRRQHQVRQLPHRARLLRGAQLGSGRNRRGRTIPNQRVRLECGVPPCT